MSRFMSTLHRLRPKKFVSCYPSYPCFEWPTLPNVYRLCLQQCKYVGYFSCKGTHKRGRSQFWLSLTL